MYQVGQSHSCNPDGKIAVIGSACRFPGKSHSPEFFFEQLLAGRTCVGPVPEGRWAAEKFTNTRDVAGKAYVARGHFLEDYDFRTFDADFFRLSPREVEFLDPQQRLLLELSWEAMENAGLDVEALAGSRTGVFVGGFTVDHLLNQFGSSARDSIGSHSAAGATLTMLSNRISYAFDFCGPSLSIDTACSSSLVALAQGVTAISAGQCEMALIGGANFMLRPEYSIAMSKGRFLARDGRSKSFDARADGYGRGEGGGIVILKDYAAALRDGDEILAIIEGAGVNQDGRTSGITVPNPEAQRALMEDVLAASGCTAEDIDYIEAHGTGTPVGDPRETSAIAQVYGRDGHCVVGSVKANIGHLEAAAGMASVIKSLMMLRHGVIPPVAGLEEVNPEIPAQVSLPRSVIPLGSTERQRRIAINSFGYGGTNAHVIIGSAPQAAGPDANNVSAASVAVLPVSARDGKALRERAGQLATLLESEPATALEDVLYTAGVRRTHLDHRLAVSGESREELAAHLRSFAAGEAPEAGSEGIRPFKGDGRIAFVYTGMGPQWWAMGRELLRENALFRQALERADAIFRNISGFSILQEMLREEGASQIKRTEFAQPANFMIQYGLTDVLKAEGIEPDSVIGHSVGEVASGWASGMLSLEDALRVSYHRSRIQATTAGTGGMLALGLSMEDAAELMAPYAQAVSFAAINSPGSVTLAGDREALECIRQSATERGVFARALDVEVPYHSPLMEPLKPALRDALAQLRPVHPHIDLYSTVTGGLIGAPGGERFYDAEYWCDNVRNPVYFADAISAMIDDGHTLFVEVGPHPVLRRSLEEIAAAKGTEIRTVSTLWMNRPETRALRLAICDIYAQGGAVDWAARTPQGRLVEMPGYPWQRQLLWRESRTQERDRLAVEQAPLSVAAGGADLNLQRLNYLFDHVVDGAPIMPAAGYLETLCEEARRFWPEQAGVQLRDVRIHQALVLDHDRALRLDISLDPLSQRARLTSRTNEEPQAAVLHAEASLYPCAGKVPVARIAAPAGMAVETLEAHELYVGLRELSLQYGPAFQSIVALQRDRIAKRAEARLCRPADAGEGAEHYVLHPSLLDGCFQVALTLLGDEDGAYLPVSLAALEVYRNLPEEIICRAQVVSQDEAQIICDFELSDPQGQLLARIDGLSCRALRGAARHDEFPAGDYQRTWAQLPEAIGQGRQAGRVLVLGECDDELADSVAADVEALGLVSDRCGWSELAGYPRLAEVQRVIGFSLAGCAASDDFTGEHDIAEMLQAVQALSAQARDLPLLMVTRNAHAVSDDEQVIPAQAAIAGFMRVVRNEFAQLRQTLVDVQADANGALPSVDRAALLDVLIAERLIDEIALRAGRPYGAKLVQSGWLQAPAKVTVSAASGVELSLQAGRYTARVLPRQSLPEDAYELEVERLALQHGAQDQPVGVVGVIVRAGSRAARFPVGMRVAGLVPRRIASRMIVDESIALLEPVSGAGASALCAPVEVQALEIVRRAVMAQGARAMVVDGALGDALSRRLEADGVVVERVSADLSDWRRDNRDGSFDMMAGPLAQWGRLTGFFPLAKGGQLVDLDRGTAPIGVPPQCGQLVRLSSDLSHLVEDEGYRASLQNLLAAPAPSLAEPQLRIAELLAEEGVELPVALLAGDWVELRVRDDEREFVAEASDLPLFRSAGVYLVTGGFGGLGCAVARWLAANGAGHVALVGRRGLDTPGAVELLDELRALGAQASAHALDVADTTAVAALVRELHRPGRPLLGIYHAAGVLEDRLLMQMQPDQLSRVMQPKTLGAWALHEAAQDCGAPLEQFVLFSSIAALVGNSRQANYCAANGYLEGLAQLRRHQGQVALAVNFGAIAGVGMLESDARIAQHLTQIGLPPLPVQTALRGLGRALVHGLEQVAISAAADWGRWASYESVGGTCATFADLIAASRASSGRDGSLVEQLHAALRGVEASEAMAILQELITGVVASGLKTTPERLRADQSFDSLGMDSLMSTDIQLQLEQKLGVTYSVIELLGASTIGKLTERALIQIHEGADGSAAL
ncbi:type I polyketide synthase [Pseudomonas sp. SCB32]|uniref:type I polyketide synthase n=1 Tax=Pseudomonas sp. SCB32 TaxID=2653853 RepID=UPI0012644A4E|nr:type I polyketide synthase [Pseudomonas sp. SCB32]